MAGHDHTPEIHEHADAWHHHIPEEGMPQHEHAAKVDSGALIQWFVGITVLLVVTIIALKMYFTKYTTEMRRTSVETSEMALKSHNVYKDAEEALGTTGGPFKYRITNKQARTVQLPISEGIQRTLAKYQGQQGPGK
jgi:hypothetical protein